MDYKKILRESAYLSGPPRPKKYLHGIIDMIPRNQIGWHQFPPLYTSESELHGSIIGALSGRGASNDHPTVQKAVHETLKHKPSLLRHYMHT